MFHALARLFGIKHHMNLAKASKETQEGMLKKLEEVVDSATGYKIELTTLGPHKNGIIYYYAHLEGNIPYPKTLIYARYYFKTDEVLLYIERRHNEERCRKNSTIFREVRDYDDVLFKGSTRIIHFSWSSPPKSLEQSFQQKVYTLQRASYQAAEARRKMEQEALLHRQQEREEAAQPYRQAVEEKLKKELKL